MRRTARGSGSAIRFALFALGVVPGALGAQDAGEGNGGPALASSSRPTLRTEARSGDIRIDGRLDEPAWERAAVARGFVQSEPIEGLPAEHDTEVRVLFDEDAIYVAARMWDTDPESIGRRLVRRDEPGDFDWFAISLDPNLDQRTGYSFQVSAAGVQADQYLHRDGDEDSAWDAVWRSAVTIDESGWSAEIRIPLSQIRYQASADPQTWGINFTRRRLASNEISHFALRSRLQEGRVSQFGRLEGVRVASSSRRVEVRPYALSSYHNGPTEEGNPFFGGREGSVRAGTEVRLGLGPAFTLDATVNPDFGQVEGDPAVINLSAIETRFGEQRPFFVEDGQVFSFGLSGGSNELFYSRRIGRSPSGRGPAGADFFEAPDAANIIGAAKLTGRTASGLSLGMLTAMTQAESGRAFFVAEESFEDYVAEPQTRYGVVRLLQDLNHGASQVGGIFTALQRTLPGEGSFDFLPAEAYSAGLNFQHQWGGRRWALNGFLAGSLVMGDSTALIRVQRAQNHYFQRPDATRRQVDSTATSMAGYEWRLQVNQQNTQPWTWSVWAAQVSDGFEVNDLGFSRNRERLDGGARLGYRVIQPGRLFRSYDIGFFNFHNFSHEALDQIGSWGSWKDAYQSGSFNLNARGTLLNYWGGDFDVSYSPDRYAFGRLQGGPAVKQPGGIGARLGIETDNRKSVSYQGGVGLRQGFDRSGDEINVFGSLSLRPSPRLEIELLPRYSKESDGGQYVGAFDQVPYEPTFGRRYLLADLERTTMSLESRLNLAFTPTLTFQLFAQPLLSSGDFVTYKQLVAPRTYEFDVFEPGTMGTVAGTPSCVGGRICETADAAGNRVQHLDFNGDGRVDASFKDRDFNVRSLVGSAVLRWEYRPGSTVFLVWQRSQANELPVGDFELMRDLVGLLGAPAHNRLILKANYWLEL